ncbi:MAG: M14 family zinc carboxypeptidase [Solirubrobacteraceae bacterium]
MSILRSLKLAAVLAPIAAAPAAAAVHLPTVQRTVTAASASKSCAAGATGSTTYTAPLAGFLTARLGAAGGDWDLYLADARSRRTLSASRAYGASEISQTWVDAGQKVLLTGCRVSGAAKTARVAFDFTDAVKPARTVSSIVRTRRLPHSVLDRISALGLDITENQHAGFTDILAPDAGRLAAFAKLGIPFQTRVADLGKVDAAARAAEARRARLGVKSAIPTGRTTYRFLADYQSEMKDIVAKYPAIAKPVTIGKTYLGREMQGVELSDNVGATDDGKPVYFLMGVHHAREWPAAETAMEFIHLIASKYGQTDTEGLRITDLLKRERIVVVPIINVDGFVASRGESAAQAQIGAIPDPEDEIGLNGTAEPVVAGGAIAYRRKNCDAGVPAAALDNDAARSFPCYYQLGVDPNRNYGFDWGGPGASNDPTTQVYRGTGQWSEPETQAVWKYSQTHPVTTLITMHTIAALVLRSPGLHTHGLAPDETLLKELGDKMGKVTGYTSQYGWQLYDTTGTTEDWNYGAVGALGYTIEIGPSGGDFHGDYETAVEDQWTGRKGTKLLGGMHDALLTAATYAADPKTHSIITGTGTPGAELTVTKSFKTASSPICTVAQGLVTVSGDGTPVDCAAPGAVFGVTEADDGLTYKTVVKPDGSFTWHITQSTRPFVGYTYDEATKLPKSNGTTEAWTLTCNGKSTTFAIERGETKSFGNVCA